MIIWNEVANYIDISFWKQSRLRATVLNDIRWYIQSFFSSKFLHHRHPFNTHKAVKQIWIST